MPQQQELTGAQATDMHLAAIAGHACTSSAVTVVRPTPARMWCTQPVAVPRTHGPHMHVLYSGGGTPACMSCAVVSLRACACNGVHAHAAWRQLPRPAGVAGLLPAQHAHEQELVRVIRVQVLADVASREDYGAVLCASLSPASPAAYTPFDD